MKSLLPHLGTPVRPVGGEVPKTLVQISRSSVLPNCLRRLVFILGASSPLLTGTEQTPRDKLLFYCESPTLQSSTLAPYHTAVIPASTRIDGARPSSVARLLIQIDLVSAPANAPLIARAQQFNLPMVADPQSGRVRLKVTHPAWPAFAAAEITHQQSHLSLPSEGWVLTGLEGLQDQSSWQAVLQWISAHTQTNPHTAWWLAVDASPPPDSWTTFPITGLFWKGVTTTPAGDPRIDGPARLQTFTRLQSQGRAMLGVEFSTHTDTERLQSLTSPLLAAGAHAFVTTPALEGLSLAPLQERSRRVLTLFGWDPVSAEKPATCPVDTLTAELLQTPLEYLGYEVDYLDIGKQPLPAAGCPDHAAVILDAELVVPAELEVPLARWLIANRAKGVPILFAGSFPFAREDAAQLVALDFGFGGSLAPQPHMRQVELLAARADVTGTETPVTARHTEYRSLTAPESADVLIDLRGIAADGNVARYHPVFIADWGAVWLEPYIILRASADNYLFYVDPYFMLSSLLRADSPLPAPDATTRDGRRLFYTHIDGDGFASRADFPGHPFCAELVRDEILTQYPFPVTVSVVEADMRGLSLGVADGDDEEIRTIARSIYELPTVRAASHSFAHPYQWDPNDPNPGLYDEPFMGLKLQARYTQVDAIREIEGSISYINENLLPADKKVELMLWSGNCRPGERALSVCRELGVENMNGGNTIVSRLYPGIAGVAPRVMQWGNELQIHAANQNEFMYTNGWNGPFYGGFADVIETFERTGKGRRLKPVNIYYHFYSATNLSSLRALEKIHDWCLSQPLHAITAAQYARVAHDAWRTRCFQQGPQHWTLVNQGDCRTFRLPKTAGVPDLQRCQGVTGYNFFGDSIYIHTQGLPVTELILKPTGDLPPDAAQAHLYLAESSAEVDFVERSRLKAVFNVSDHREVAIQFAGLPANLSCDVTINGKRSPIPCNPQGHLLLQLPASATVVVDASRLRHATSD